MSNPEVVVKGINFQVINKQECILLDPEKNLHEMAGKKITVVLGQAIRESKYLAITYKNQNEEINPFWISISDINTDGEIYVNIFNVTKDDPIYNARIFISRIQTAEIHPEELKP